MDVATALVLSLGAVGVSFFMFFTVVALVCAYLGNKMIQVEIEDNKRLKKRHDALAEEVKSNIRADRTVMWPNLWSSTTEYTTPEDNNE